MVFSINPTANKTNAAFMAMAMAQNSTTVLPAGVNNSGMSSAIAAAVGPSATTIVSASSAGAPPLAATQTAPTVGNGTASKTGETCSCSCLCGVAAFPAGAGLGSFGGMSGIVIAADKASYIHG